ncbi:MAG: LysE family translocator [Acidobacteriota bacterium]
MIDPLLAAYVTFTILFVVTPGATTALVIRNTLAGGPAAGLAAAAGAAVGNASHATAAGLGMAILLARWPAALQGLRVAGAVYLAWLGLVSVGRMLGRGRSGAALDVATAAPGRHASVREGITVNLLNPAIPSFYLAVVTSFVPAHAPMWYFAGLAAFHVGTAFLVHSLWALAFGRLRAVFRHPTAQRTLEGLTGLALLALAARVLMP